MPPVCNRLRMKIEENIRFKNFSVVCAILVVMIHSNAQPINGTWQEAIMRVVQYVEKIAVPFFFLASGFFLSVRMGERGWYVAAIRKRLRTLVLPFYIWQVSFIVFMLCMIGIGALLGYEVAYDRRLIRFDDGGVWYWLGLHPFLPVNIVWYLRMLFFLCLLSPLTTNVYMRRIMLVMSFAAYTMHEGGIWSGDAYVCLDNFFSVRGLFFFIIGIDLAKGGLPLLYNRVLFAVSLLGTVIMLVLMALSYKVCACVNCLGVVAMLVVLLNLTPCNRWRKWLYEMTFPVYLIHLYILIVMNYVVKMMDISVWWQGSLLAFYLRVLLAFCCSCGIAIFIQRYFPRFGAIAFGGRGPSQRRFYEKMV